MNAISEVENIYTMEGNVVHLDYTYHAPSSTYMQSFLDFFMLSRANRVYSIGTSQMYPSEFPLYASKVHNVPFERINIDAYTEKFE